MTLAATSRRRPRARPRSSYASRPWLRHYDYWVQPHLNYPQRPLPYILDQIIVELPGHPATHFLGATLTYQQLGDMSNALAHAFLEIGVRHGTRVGIMLPNCPQYIVAAFAALRLGAVVVNINPAYTARELEIIAADSELSVLLTLDELAPMAMAMREHTAIRTVITTVLSEFGADGAPPGAVPGATPLADLVGTRATRVDDVAIQPNDIAVLQYTGGTTGTPKGAMLTHANIFANVVQTEAFLYPTVRRGESRYLMILPYFHIYGFCVGMMRGLWVGATQMLIPKYDAAGVLAAIRDFRPTNVPAVPTVFISLLKHPRLTDHAVDRVRTFSTGAAPCPTSVIHAWERATGRTLYEGFGLTEASPVTHMTPQLAVRKPGTVGVPLPDTDMKIVDLDAGTREQPIGRPGELCLVGPQIMKGYWRNESETRGALRRDADGRVWLYTGDIASMDDDGFTTIVQRKKDMAIVNGLNVYPSEVERVLLMHPAVRQAAVIGVPHPVLGESLEASVVLCDDAHVDGAALLEHCSAYLAPFKRPRRIMVRESLPMTAVGKVLYRTLREEAARRADDSPRCRS